MRVKSSCLSGPLIACIRGTERQNGHDLPAKCRKSVSTWICLLHPAASIWEVLHARPHTKSNQHEQCYGGVAREPRKGHVDDFGDSLQFLLVILQEKESQPAMLPAL
jgi:hypothetical protein